MQTWIDNGSGLASLNLSEVLRTRTQPLLRYRQHCSVEDAFGKHKGQLFHWDIFSDIDTDGRVIEETEEMPEGAFTVSQGTGTVVQRGMSVPYSGMYDDLSMVPVTKLIDKLLKNNCAKAQEAGAFEQWDATLLIVTPTSGTSETSITIEVDGTPAATNNVALGLTHVNLIVDEMKERLIPTMDGTNYGCIGLPSTFRPLKDDLEAVSMYTERGYGEIYNGEIGRSFGGVRFFESTGQTTEAWTNGKSDACFFFGDDTVVEGVAVYDQIRAKLPGGYGLSKGIAWYSLNGYAIVHNQTLAPTNRIMKWSSAA